MVLCIPAVVSPDQVEVLSTVLKANHTILRKAAVQQRDGGSGKHEILGSLLLHLLTTYVELHRSTW